MLDQSNKNIPLLGIIVPCYNEEEVLPYTKEKLIGVLREIGEKGKITDGSFIAFIDDGSHDKTWELIVNYKNESSSIKGIKLSRNYGHQCALLAGLTTFLNDADCMVTIDADLQDDIKVIEQMIDQYRDGIDIVYGIRKERKTDAVFKRLTAHGFYKFMKILGVDILYNHADFRLVSRRVLEQLGSFNEVNLFLRGIFPLIGYPSANVYYNRLSRSLGESKYPFPKMLAFAFEGISSFSVKPLRLVSLIGIAIFFLSLVMAGYALYSYFFRGTVPGWTSITLPVYFISGIQILCIGIIAEYIGKIYQEVKARPRFIIEKILK
jgi:glycosyltransferase involved in cell wall biosynthesis